MRKVAVLLLAVWSLASLAVAQNLRVDGVVQSRSGLPAPGANVAVCSEIPITAISEVGTTVTVTSSLNPPLLANVVITGISPVAYNGAWVVTTTSASSYTFTHTTSGLAAGMIFGWNITATAPCAPLVALCSSLTDTGCTSPNPVISDGLGNYSLYAAASATSHYALEFYGSGLTTRIQSDQSIGVAPAAGPNTSVQFDNNGILGGFGTWNVSTSALTIPGSASFTGPLSVTGFPAWEWTPDLLCSYQGSGTQAQLCALQLSQSGNNFAYPSWNGTGTGGTNFLGLIVCSQDYMNSAKPTSGQVPTWNVAKGCFDFEAGGGGGTPANPTGSVQFNNSGVFGGDANFKWDGTNHHLNIGGTTNQGCCGFTLQTIPNLYNELDSAETNGTTTGPFTFSGDFMSYLNPAANSNVELFSLNGATEVLAASTHNFPNELVGVHGETDNFGTGTVSNIFGVSGEAFNQGTGVVTNATGTSGFAGTFAGGTNVTTAIGIQGIIASQGSSSPVIVNGYAIRAASPNIPVGSTISHFRGLRIEDPTGSGGSNPDPLAIEVVAGNMKLGTGLVTQYAGNTLVSNGIPSIIAKADNTSATTNLGPTTVLTTAATGTYRLYCYVVLITPAGTSSTLPGCTMAWNDADTNVGESLQVTTATSGSNLAGQILYDTGHALLGMVTVNARTGTNITYQTTGYASSPANAMVYGIHVKVEYLGP